MSLSPCCKLARTRARMSVWVRMRVSIGVHVCVCMLPRCVRDLRKAFPRTSGETFAPDEEDGREAVPNDAGVDPHSAQGEVIWGGCHALRERSPTGLHVLNHPTLPTTIVA